MASGGPPGAEEEKIHKTFAFYSEHKIKISLNVTMWQIERFLKICYLYTNEIEIKRKRLKI